ncbi:hypothetical protein EXS54_02685 [Patescibacteria group bacterium]|nr:hypothetical protein [Patescibacteria group bacterium]
MNRLKQLAPWQITAIAVGVLAVFLVGGYLLVTLLTSTPPPPKATSSIPSNLDSASNQKVVKELDTFEPSDNLPLLTEPLRTPDPNGPSSVNPFE